MGSKKKRNLPNFVILIFFVSHFRWIYFIGSLGKRPCQNAENKPFFLRPNKTVNTSRFYGITVPVLELDTGPTLLREITYRCIL